MKHFESVQPNFRGRRLLLAALALLFVPLLLGCTGATKPVGWAAPVQSGDLTIVPNNKGQVVALRIEGDRTNVAWTFPPEKATTRYLIIRSTRVTPRLDAIYGTPLPIQVNGKARIVLVGYSGEVTMVDPATGQLAEGWPESVNVGSKVVTTPAFDGKSLFVADYQGRVHRIDAATGQKGDPLLDTTARMWSSPVIEADTLYVAGMDRKLRAFDPANGTSKWERDLGGSIAGDVAIEAGTMYVPTLGSRVVALDLGNGGAERWAFEGDNWFWATPLVTSDSVYAATANGTVYALDRANGRARWQFDAGGDVRSKPVIVGGTLIVVTRNGLDIGIDPGNGSERWRAQSNADLPLLSNPLVLESAVLYTAKDGKLISVSPANGGSEQMFPQPEN